MDDIEELSNRLFRSDYFMKELREKIEQFSKEKTEVNEEELFFIKPLPETPTLEINEKFMELTEEPQFSEERPSITSSAFEKRESRDSISSMNSNPIFQQYIQTYSMSQGHTINALTTEITNNLAEMVKRECDTFNGVKVNGIPGALSNENFSEFIESIQAIQKQELNSVRESLEEKLEALKSEIELQVTSVIEKIKLERKAKKINEKSSLIKRQRKKVTQSILELSKNNQEMSTFSNIYDIDNILSNSEEESEEPSSLLRTSPQEISHLSSKITEVEKSQLKITREFEEKFLKEVEQNKKDVQQLTEKIIEWKLKNEEKLENGFTGVWNVVTDIEDKLNKVTLRVAEIEHTLS